MTASSDAHDLYKLFLVGFITPVIIVIFLSFVVLFCFICVWFGIAIINHFAGYQWLVWG